MAKAKGLTRGRAMAREVVGCCEECNCDDGQLGAPSASHGSMFWGQLKGSRSVASVWIVRSSAALPAKRIVSPQPLRCISFALKTKNIGAHAFE